MNYRTGLPFLRIHSFEYYFEKNPQIIYSSTLRKFDECILTESIESFVPSTQANILTAIINIITPKKLNALLSQVIQRHLLMLKCIMITDNRPY